MSASRIRHVLGGLRDSLSGSMIQLLPPDMSAGGNQAFNATSAAIDVTGAAVIRVVCDQDCYLDFGTSAAVTAAVGDYLVPAGAEIIALPEGTTHVAVIQSSTGGTLNWRKMG